MRFAPLQADIDLLPLTEMTVERLASLLDEQCDEWLKVFRWSYAEPSRLIRHVLKERELTGFAALVNEQVVGFAFYVTEEERASIGDLYVSPKWRGCGIDRRLAEALVSEIEGLGKIRRIESQSLTVANGDVEAFFAERGFTRFERAYMLCALPSSAAQAPRRAFRRHSPTPEISVHAWRDKDFEEAAHVIHFSYRGESDSRINSQYASITGCIELLSILTDSIWCGHFLPMISHTATDRESGNLIGVLLASRISKGVGHIGQISILPTYQDIGIGRRLLQAALDGFEQRGYEAVTLAVTKENQSALHLYEACGFCTIHTFSAYCRESE